MSKIILTTDGQIVDTETPIQPTTINIFLAVSNNNLNRLLITIYSLLKYSQSNFNIYIMTDVTDIDVDIVKRRFKGLMCDRLTIHILPSTPLDEIVRRDRLRFDLTALTYSKMLIPSLLPELDRVLYLDYDTATIKEGIEWLYNIDFKDKYIAIADGTISCNKQEACQMVFNEHKIFSTFGDFYFNNGVILFNIQKIIKDGKDREMIEMLKNPPNSQNNEELEEIRNKINYRGGILNFNIRDNSFMNWLFRKDDVIRCNKIFNSEEDNLYTINENRVNYLKNQWEFKDYQDYFDNIVIAHFCGPAKPWYNRLGDISEYQNSLFEKYIEIQREMRDSLND